MNEARGGRDKDRYLVFAANSVRMPFWPSNSIAPRRLTVAMAVVVGIVLIVTVANIAGMLQTGVFIRAALVAFVTDYDNAR